MQGFKKYIKEDDDVQKALSKLPASHRALVKGYEFLFEPGNTLRGDKEHIGMITNQKEKRIVVAAPFYHSREFTTLHEVAHLVYERFVRGTPFEKEWEKVAMSEPNRKKDETAEELWCHNYANYFAKNQVVIHTHPEWMKYMDNFVKQTS